MFVHHAWSGRAAVAATLALVVVATVGCTGPTADPSPEPTTVTTPEPTPEPEVTPTEEPEATTEPGPEPTVIERPEAMDDMGDEGAIAAAEYFALLVHLLYSADVDAEVRAMSNESCNFCSSLLGSAEEFRVSGNLYVGGEAELLGGTEIVGRDEVTGVIGVVVPLAVHAAEEWTSHGELVDTWPELEAAPYFELAHTYLGWLVIGGVYSGVSP